MKFLNKCFLGLSSAMLLFASCSDFEDINRNPSAVDEGNVQIAHLLNRSIFKAQQDPHIAERIFVLTWKRASRYDRGSGFTIGTDNDGWNDNYYSTDWGVGWLNSANNAVNLGKKRIDEGTATDVEKNVYEMARIWRAYLISELSDCFGPIPATNAFDGTVAPYQSVKDLYTFILDELKDAAGKLDLSVDMASIAATNNNSDMFFNGNMEKWQRYANSMRLRYAMRLSVTDPATAKAHITELANAPLIETQDQIARVQEKATWDGCDGVMSRPWNAQPISSTMNNILLGLGGVDIQLHDTLKSQVNLINPNEKMGIRLEHHLPVSTNDPSAGFFFNGLPSKIDPRAIVMFNIPGYDDSKAEKRTYPQCFSGFAGKVKLGDHNDPEGKVTDNSIELNVQYTWNTWVAGKWDKKSSLSSKLTGESINYPSAADQYRNSTNYRIWFGNWETYFLLAEAAEYGWISGSAKDYYEKGVRASFEYNGVAQFADEYLASETYNRVGTSAKFDHVAEAQPHEVSYIDGYTKEVKTMTYTYPNNSVYKNGVNNDHLTKIITQKYIANCPYLPLESWNDHRRLGLPFFENQAVEVDYVPSNHEVPLTKATAKECKWEFYPKRMRYPASMETNSKASYEQAIGLLGGVNDTNVPLYWCMPKK